LTGRDIVCDCCCNDVNNGNVPIKRLHYKGFLDQSGCTVTL